MAPPVANIYAGQSLSADATILCLQFSRCPACIKNDSKFIVLQIEPFRLDRSQPVGHYLRRVAHLSHHVRAESGSIVVNCERGRIPIATPVDRHAGSTLRLLGETTGAPVEYLRGQPDHQDPRRWLLLTSNTAAARKSRPPG
jgi:hypothetical protein